MAHQHLPDYRTDDEVDNAWTQSDHDEMRPLSTGRACDEHVVCNKQRSSVLSLPDVVERDSGTESDEELEMIETNSMASFAFSHTSDCYTSQPSWSISSCHSPHGSPNCQYLFNDQDSNGSDPGQQTALINNNSNGVDHLVTSDPPDLPAHQYHTRQQFQRLKEQSNYCAATGLVEDNAPPASVGAKTAFVSLKRGREELPTICASSQESNVSWPLVQRRTAPVRLLIPPPPPSDEDDEEEVEANKDASRSENTSPRKKTRHSALSNADGNHTTATITTRPCLNFEKMQQKLVRPLRKKSTKRESLKAKVKLRAWSDGYQLRSCGNNFLFQPLETAEQQSVGAQMEKDINDLVRQNCRL